MASFLSSGQMHVSDGPFRSRRLGLCSACWVRSGTRGLSDSGTPGGDRARGDKVFGLQRLLQGRIKERWGGARWRGQHSTDKATQPMKHRSCVKVQLDQGPGCSSAWQMQGRSLGATPGGGGCHWHQGVEARDPAKELTGRPPSKGSPAPNRSGVEGSAFLAEGAAARGSGPSGDLA